MNTTTHPGAIETVKTKSIDAIKGAGNIVEATVNTAARAGVITVKDTAKVGGEVLKDAKGLVAGAEKAVAAVADRAIKTAGDVASTTVGAIHDVVIKPISGDKSALKAPAVATAKR